MRFAVAILLLASALGPSREGAEAAPSLETLFRYDAAAPRQLQK